MAAHRTLSCWYFNSTSDSITLPKQPDGFTTKSAPKLYEHLREEHKLTATGPGAWKDPEGNVLSEKSITRDSKVSGRKLKLPPGSKPVSEEIIEARHGGEPVLKVAEGPPEVPKDWIPIHVQGDDGDGGNLTVFGNFEIWNHSDKGITLKIRQRERLEVDVLVVTER